MKYYVARRHPTKGVQFRMNKCLDNKWCYAEYLLKYPEDVWQFSKQGATKIVKRYREDDSRYFEYFIVPVDNVLAYSEEVRDA